MKRKHFGFTLLNLLISIVIAALLVSVGTPSYSKFTSKNQARNAYERLFTLIQFTRIQAVNYQSQVLLCPSSDKESCIDNWNKPLIVFVDTNNDEKRTAGELILRITPKLLSDESLYWKASGSKRYLRFKADGSTRNQNGRLTYCLQKGNDVYAEQIIVYRSGRIRKSSRTEAKQQC